MSDLEIGINFKMEEMESLITKVVEKLLLGIRYDYRTITVREILQVKKGPLGIQGMRIMGNRNAKVEMVMRNRAVVQEYVNELDENGWEFKGCVYAENMLPYGGMLVFRRPKILAEVEAEEVTAEALKNVDIYFEDKPEKKINTGRELLETSNSFKEKIPVIDTMNMEIPQEKVSIMTDKSPEIKIPRKIPQHKSVKKTINLNDEFEKKHPGKKAIFHGKETKGFQTFKKNYIKGLLKDE